MVEGAKKKAAKEAQDVEGQRRREKKARKKKQKLERLFPDLAGDKKPKKAAGKEKKIRLRVDNDVAKANKAQDPADPLAEDVEMHLEENSSEDGTSSDNGDEMDTVQELPEQATQQAMLMPGTPGTGQGMHAGEALHQDLPCAGNGKETEHAGTKSAAPAAASDPKDISQPSSGCCVIS